MQTSKKDHSKIIFNERIIRWRLSSNTYSWNEKIKLFFDYSYNKWANKRIGNNSFLDNLFKNLFQFSLFQASHSGNKFDKDRSIIGHVASKTTTVNGHA